MKPITELSPEDVKALLFYTSPDGTMIPISKITSLSPDKLVLGNDTYTINAPVYESLQAKLTTYEGIKLMYAQEDLTKQAASLTETSFSDNFKEYFDHMDDVISHVNTQAAKVITNLQSTVDAVKTKAESTLSNINSINDTIKPFKQLAEDTNLYDLKKTIKANVEQLAPVKDELGEVIAHLKDLFSKPKVS